MANDIMGGVFEDPSLIEQQSLLQEGQEELPEVTPGQHEAILSHVLGEGKRMDAVKQKGREMVGRTKAYVTGKKGAYSWKNQKPGAKKERTLKGDLKSLAGKVKKKVKNAFAPLTDAQRKEAGLQDRHKYLTGGDVKPLPKPKKFKADKSGTVRSADRYGEGEVKKMNDSMGNITQDQIDTLRRAKEIVAEMTSVGSVGVNMAGGKSKSAQHPAMLVKLPSEKDQAKQIKAASTPPKIMQVKAPKESSPAGRKNKAKGIKRKSAQSKDDETQFRVHQDMEAMYHESFSNFVGEILTENADGKGYPGDVSVADFGRKGPASDTFGGGGVRTGGRGPLIKLTKNQLMTAKKRAAGKGQDKGTSGFGKASSHSTKHPQNPYAGGK